MSGWFGVFLCRAMARWRPDGSVRNGSHANATGRTALPERGAKPSVFAQDPTIIQHGTIYTKWMKGGDALLIHSPVDSYLLIQFRSCRQCWQENLSARYFCCCCCCCCCCYRRRGVRLAHVTWRMAAIGGSWPSPSESLIIFIRLFELISPKNLTLSLTLCVCYFERSIIDENLWGCRVGHFFLSMGPFGGVWCSMAISWDDYEALHN